MKTKFIFLILLLIHVCIFGQTLEPQLLSTAGKEFINNDNSLSWSLGEISINTIYSNDAILTQGFQQTGIYTTATLNPEMKMNLSLYPNPTFDYITIKIEDDEYDNKAFRIIDISGKICYHGIITSKKHIIDISNFTAGLYFITLTREKDMIITNSKFFKTNK